MPDNADSGSPFDIAALVERTRLRLSAYARRHASLLALSPVLIIGLAIRSIVAFSKTNVVRPDELFQYIEQGHRLAFGSGVVPWEYDIGIRSWFLPSLIAGV